MFADRLGVEEWTCVEESQMHCSEKGLNGRAEECLVHVFYPVLDVCDCVDVVGVLWRAFDVVGLLWQAFGRRGCGVCAWFGSGRGRGSDGKPPQIGEGISFALEDKALLVPDAARCFCERCRAPCVTEGADGDE